MFDECLQFCLQLIGTQPPHTGCTAAQLSEFITEDVLPHEGWAANDHLRDAIVRLLLTAHAGEVELYTSTPVAASLTIEPLEACDSGGGRASCSRWKGAGAAAHLASSSHGGSTGKSSSSSVVPAPPGAPALRHRVSPAQAVELLDLQRVMWHTEDAHRAPASAASASPPARGPTAAAATKRATASAAGDRPTMLIFVPSRPLRERVLGFPIQTEREEMVACFIAEGAVRGWEWATSLPHFTGRYKSHLVGNGLNWLRRLHRVARLYLYSSTTDEITARFFPHFALPPTTTTTTTTTASAANGTVRPTALRSAGPAASEKVSGEGSEEENVYTERDSHTAVSSADYSTSGAADPNAPVAPPSTVEWARHPAGPSARPGPLAHFFARLRRHDATFPETVFDIAHVHELVAQSPERRLLLQDAVHAVLTAHGLHRRVWERLSRLQHTQLRRLLTDAGLRIVAATARLRGHWRELRLVIPAEDMELRVGVGRLRADLPHGALTDPESAGGRAWKRGSGAEDGEDEDAADATHSADRVPDALLVQHDDELDGAEDAPCSGNDSDGGSDVSHGSAGSSRGSGADGHAEEGDGDGMDGDEEEDGRVAVSGDAAAPPPSYAAQRQQRAAMAVLRLDAGHPLDLQAAQEAERRPLSLTAITPRLRFHTATRLLRRGLTTALQGYAGRKGTLSMQQLLLPQTKGFTVVYAPRLPAAAVAVQPVANPVTESGGGEGAAAAPTHDALQEGSARDEATREADITGAAASLPRTWHFEFSDPRLPKGLSAYAVNTVLDVLMHATPHRAASLPRLCKAVDFTTLHRRVLPFLRAHAYVTTTVVAQRGRRHVGLVVLLPLDPAAAVAPLSDKEKLAVCEAEAQAASAAAASSGHNEATAGDGQPAHDVAHVRAGRAIPSDLVLLRVPAPVTDLPSSAWGERLRDVDARTQRAVNSVIAARNGYARSLALRASRLHLELWRQQHLHPPDADTGVTRVEEMRGRMSLSTFAIVVGFPQADLTRVLRAAGSTCHWGTPVQDLPPSVAGWCRQQGGHALAACLQELQERELVRAVPCPGREERDGLVRVFAAELLGSAAYVLEPQGTADGFTVHFTLGTSAGVSAASSVYACMRYWLPVWSAAAAAADVRNARAAAIGADVTVAQVVALAHFLRRLPGALAAQLYQYDGMPHEPPRPTRLRDVLQATGSAAVGAASGTGERGRRPSRYVSSAAGARRRGRGDLEVADGDGDGDEGAERAAGVRGGKWGGAAAAGGAAAGRPSHLAQPRGPLRAAAPYQPLRRMRRIAVGGVSVAEALEAAFDHHAPLKRVEVVVRYVLRIRSVHLAQHPLCTASPVPLLGLAQTRHAAGLAAPASAMPAAVAAMPTEFALSNTGQGGNVYNRLVTASTTHMAGLAATLCAVRRGHAQHQPRASQMDVLREELESVYAPDVAAAADVGAAATAGAGAKVVKAFSAGEGATAPPAAPPHTGSEPADAAPRLRVVSPHASAVAALEVVADVLRMVLLSDQAHYRGSVAQSLVVALHEPSLVARARAALQRLPAFTARQRHGSRVPLLSLHSAACVLSSRALAKAPQPCANIAVLERVAQAADAVAAAMTGGRESAALQAEHPVLSAYLRGDVPQLVPVAVPLEVVHQPCLDVDCFADGASAARTRLTQIPLPQLAWPADALAREVPRPPQRGRRYGGEGDAGREDEAAADAGVAGRGRRRGGRPRRAWAAAAAAASEADVKSELGDGGGSGGDDGDVDEGEDARVEAETARLMYPARGLCGTSTPAYVRDLPIDGAPTEAELRGVEACRAAFRAGDFAAFEVPAAGYRIAYPSIFHHVDGSWHTYMWCLVVHTVYSYLVCVPGIQHTDLEARLLASGVVSARALRAVMRFLVDSRAVVCRQEELMQPQRSCSPFQPRKRARISEGHAATAGQYAAAGGVDGGCSQRGADAAAGSGGGGELCCSYVPVIAPEQLQRVVSAGFAHGDA